MFESITRRERVGTAEKALVVAVAAVAFGAQLLLFRGTVGQPLAAAMAEIRTRGELVPRDSLPELVEEIVVVAPYRPRRLVHARAARPAEDAAWAAPEYGLCPSR